MLDPFSSIARETHTPYSAEFPLGVFFLVSSHLQTLECFQQGQDIDTIAKARDLTESTVQNHLVRCWNEGHGVDWDRLIPSQYEGMIVEVIKQAETSSLREIKEALPETITYAAIKAVLCKHFKKEETPAGH